MTNPNAYEVMKEYTRSGKKITPIDRVVDSAVRGVYVITTNYEGEINGMSACMYSRVSSDPVYILVCVWHKNYSNALIKKAKCFAVNILAEDGVDFAKHFGRHSKRDVDKFKRQDIYWDTKATGSPILLDALAYMDCKLIEAHETPGGDHTMCIGEVVDAGFLREAKPLVYRREDYPYRVLKFNE
jgi:flavin reductase (DIM6/NTAB) family NADH-FMN oxidoreductase RutF